MMRLFFSSSLMAFVFVSIVAFALVTRMWRISTPSTYYFDEVYHAVTSKLVARNDARAYEWWNPAPEKDTAVDWLHPPFAKLTQSLSMLVFGENSFGWRFSSVVFGTATVGVLYFVARELGFDETTSLASTGLLALSGLALSMSRIAMNDIHVTFFILLSVGLYWRWRKSPTLLLSVLVGLSTGLAFASKWSGIFLLGLFAFDTAARFKSDFLQNRTLPSRVFVQLWASLLLLIPTVYFLSYGQMFLQGKDLTHWWELHQQIWWYQTNLEATHPYQSTPLQWVLNLRPVYAFTDSTSTVLADIYLQENPTLAWFGVVAVIWTLADVGMYALSTMKVVWKSAMTQQKKWQTRLKKLWLQSSDTYRLLFVVAAYAVFWLPWVISPRIMFFYHYLPSIPFLCLLLAYQLQFLRQKFYGNGIAIGIIGIIALNFVLFYPHWTGLPVDRELWSWLYFALPQWQ
ncbi:phospholipid carrier-dependent glycosyltransferase [Candidatus Woesebacteria bacterium]|nr:phospholipid carrier-dependent glycosyltransferase [Candidatus Woesebacteria bacterium]